MIAGYPSTDQLKLLEDLIPGESEHNANHLKIQTLLYSDLGARLPLHISLSRPVVLRTEQRSSFTDLLEKEIQESHIPP